MGGQWTHVDTRAAAVNWIRTHPEDFSPFVPEHRGLRQNLDQYMDRMSKDGQWGDSLTLEAMCKSFSVHSVVLKRMDNGDIFWTQSGDSVNALSTLWLFLTRKHYENLLVESQIQ